MQKFQLELFCHILGIGSASGLLFNNNSIFLIADNSNVLYEYNISDKKTDKLLLSDKEPSENIPKPEKPDFEAITRQGNMLYLFGSGSTEKRNTIATVDVQAKKVTNPINATDLYLVMQSFGELSPQDFNIEAAVNDGDKWYLFNRGNGPAGKNGIFTLDGDINTASFQIAYNDIKLPKINGVQATFTDAVKVGNKLYFIAAAENSGSTYADGTIAGTLAGRIDIDKMKPEYTQVISDKNKFEGITVYKDAGTTLEFLLCEDDDKNSTETDIYRLVIKK